MAWHDSSTCCFVFNSNVGQLSADRAASTLRKGFVFLPGTFSVEHSFCLTTSKEPGLLNTGSNPDIVQVSCLLLNVNIQLTSDFQLAYGKNNVGCLFKCVGITVDEFKALSSAKRIGLAEVLLWIRGNLYNDVVGSEVNRRPVVLLDLIHADQKLGYASNTDVI